MNNTTRNLKMKKTIKKKQKQVSRKQLEAQKRQTDILLIAEKVFQESGFSATKAEEIARQANISVGTIYNTFGNKEKLYAKVLEKIGNELVDQVSSINRKYGPAKAFEKIIALRLSNYRRQGLFLMPFSMGYVNNDKLSSSNILEHPRDLYYKYIDLISKIIEKGINMGFFEPVNSLAAAIGFEGILNSFVNYWLAPDNPQQQEWNLNEIKKAVMEVLRLKRHDSFVDSQKSMHSILNREVFITKYDYLRLKELLDVAQMFNTGKHQSSLEHLTKALNEGKIVNSDEVPDDVITMNSKLQLTNMENGETNIIRLVFPSDITSSDDAVSILTPLGSVLLGQWKNSTVKVEEEGCIKKYNIEDILYQPESAGDFHL